MQDLYLERDPHSYYRSDQPQMQHVDWEVEVDFQREVLACKATIRFDRSGRVDLDTRGLTVKSVTTKAGASVTHTLYDPEPILGSRLTVEIPEGIATVCIHYETSPDASGLQWMETDAGSPFLYSQGQCIHGRSYLPCQDSPGVRFTYTAELLVPKDLRGLMAADRHVEREVRGDDACERWAMSHPIPAYLVAFAVGELVSKDISNRTRVWAAPDMVQAAASEFSDVPKMMEEAETLFGPYLWGRFDLLVMPPSFPYGGMENPCLTFITPAVITGDKSMVNVVAHELAHAWTGNLVTNRDWRCFWLNEGFTTWAEWEISERLYGLDESMVWRALLRREFKRDCERFSRTGHPLYTSLAPDMVGVDPDDLLSRVPYFKGAMFLWALENVGWLSKKDGASTPSFENVVRAYIERFKFRSISTAEFLDFIAENLPGALDTVKAWRWVYEAGMPEATSPWHPAIESKAIRAVSEIDGASSWTASQWMLYLELLERPQREGFLADLDLSFKLAHHKHPEVRWAYLLLCAESGYDRVLVETERFLGSYGRMKYIEPIFAALARTPKGLKWARGVYERVKGVYHPIARSQVERVFREAETAHAVSRPVAVAPAR